MQIKLGCMSTVKMHTIILSFGKKKPAYSESVCTQNPYSTEAITVPKPYPLSLSWKTTEGQQHSGEPKHFIKYWPHLRLKALGHLNIHRNFQDSHHVWCNLIWVPSISNMRLTKNRTNSQHMYLETSISERNPSTYNSLFPLCLSFFLHNLCFCAAIRSFVFSASPVGKKL